MKKLMMILAMTVVLAASCKKAEDPSLTTTCDVSYRYYSSSWHTKTVHGQKFTGTPDEIETEKTTVITTLTAQGFKDVKIFNCK